MRLFAPGGSTCTRNSGWAGLAGLAGPASQAAQQVPKSFRALASPFSPEPSSNQKLTGHQTSTAFRHSMYMFEKKGLRRGRMKQSIHDGVRIVGGFIHVPLGLDVLHGPGTAIFSIMPAPLFLMYT